MPDVVSLACTCFLAGAALLIGFLVGGGERHPFAVPADRARGGTGDAGRGDRRERSGTPASVAEGLLLRRNRELESLVERLRSDAARAREVAGRHEEASERKSEFVAMVSHELKGPLTSLRNSFEILGRLVQLADDDSRLRFLDMAKRNVTRLQRISDDLLDLSKVERGCLSVELAVTDLQSLAAHVLDAHRVEASRRGLSLSLECGPDLPAAWADEGRIEQVLTNLMANAMKFTPLGGSIILRLREVDERIEVSVVDTGVGLSASEAERVFDRFFQGARGVEAGRSSVGLGLFISHRLLAAQDSELQLESAPGRGSRFHFSLPIARPLAAPSAREESGSSMTATS